MATVLLVEDDPAARQGLELALRLLGYMVRAAETGEAALRDFRDAAADVVVLDLMLPGLDGFEVCRRLRRGSDIPVIMLTARGDDLDIVGGLEAGADDYVVKPVEPRVLDARIRAVLRRIARPGSPVETHGELVIDTMAAALAGKIAQLERMEARARQFAADVSHELRTPLTAMTAVADILHDQPAITGEAAAAARLVSQEIRHLNRLVNDLIEISRFDAGTARLVCEDTDIAACVAACLHARNWA